jgi:hypothetical protein
MHTDLDRAQDDLGRYEARLAEVEREVDLLMAEREALRPVVQGLRQLLSTVPPRYSPRQTRLIDDVPSRNQPEVGRPEGAEAIARLLQTTRSGEEWTMDEIFHELERRGWTSTRSANPKGAARAALQRLVNAGTVESTARNRFRLTLAPDSGEASSDASASDDDIPPGGLEAR